MFWLLQDPVPYPSVWSCHPSALFLLHHVLTQLSQLGEPYSSNIFTLSQGLQSLQQKSARSCKAGNSHEEKLWKWGEDSSSLWISTGKFRPHPSFEITELQSSGVQQVEMSESETQWGKCKEGATEREKQDYLESFVFKTSFEGRKEGNCGKKVNGSSPQTLLLKGFTPLKYLWN